MEAINGLEYWHWIVLGLLLVITEIFITSFVVIWFGVSALIVGGVLLLFNLGLPAQLFLWGALSAVSLAAWFKFVRPKMKDVSLSGMSRERIIGQEGMVIDVKETDRGTVRFSLPVLGDDEWPFICKSPVAVGDRVTVSDLSGNTLIVTHRNPHSGDTSWAD